MRPCIFSSFLLLVCIHVYSIHIPQSPALAEPICIPLPSSTLARVSSSKDDGQCTPSFSSSAPSSPSEPRRRNPCRYVEDDFITPLEVAQLLNLSKTGMARADVGAAPSPKVPVGAGPTILDLNSGLLRNSVRLQNVYAPLFDKATMSVLAETVTFQPEDFELYGRIFERIHQKLMQVYNLTALYFTSPTFITRIVGHKLWRPKDAHDEYYQPHADGLSSPQYSYSGLLYLSDYGIDFKGGKFRFYNRKPSPKKGDKGSRGGEEDKEDDAPDRNNETKQSQKMKSQEEEGNDVIEPRAGRLLLFSSGDENWHRVERVLSGNRFVFSMWFSCDKSHEFVKFLDGKAHVNFTSSNPDQPTRRLDYEL